MVGYALELAKKLIDVYKTGEDDKFLYYADKYVSTTKSKENGIITIKAFSPIGRDGEEILAGLNVGNTNTSPFIENFIMYAEKMLLLKPTVSLDKKVANEINNIFREDYKIVVQVTPVIDHKVRGLCTKPYPNHKKGCPNFEIKKGCPPSAPYFEKYYDMEKPIYAIINRFACKPHTNKMRLAHPDWSDRQINCVLYWQGRARKYLKAHVISF